MHISTRQCKTTFCTHYKVLAAEEEGTGTWLACLQSRPVSNRECVEHFEAQNATTKTPYCCPLSRSNPVIMNGLNARTPCLAHTYRLHAALTQSVCQYWYHLYTDLYNTCECSNVWCIMCLRYVRVRCVFCSLCVVDICTTCWVTLAATLLIHFHNK